MKKLILFVTALFMMTGIAYAGNLCLEWDANTTDQDIAGYRIFVREKQTPIIITIPHGKEPERHAPSR